MKKLLIAGLLSLAGLALYAPPSYAWLWHHCGCCSRCCTTICIRPYNAFSPICCGNFNCVGCMPFCCGGMSGGDGCCGPSGMGMPSVFSDCCPPPAGFPPTSCCSSGCCDPGCLPAPNAVPPAPAAGQAAVPQPLPAPQNLTPPPPVPAVSYYRQPQMAYTPVQPVAYQNGYYPYVPAAPYAGPAAAYGYPTPPAQAYGYPAAYGPTAPQTGGVPSYWYGGR